MQADSITQSGQPGRPRLSPNRLDEEMKREHKRRHRKKLKPDASRLRTELRKRQQDKLRRAQRKQLRRRRLLEPLGQTVRRRVKAVRYYRHWRQHLSEKDAAQRSASKFEMSVDTIRHWDRLYRRGGLGALLPQPPGPPSLGVVPLEIQFLVVALRRLLGWDEKRMAKELGQRGIAQISHTTVGHIFARYHLPTRTYHPRARRDGILKRRYEKPRPNQQWHIDFAETHLEDGTRVVILVLTDDYSRYCLRCQVVPDMTAETAIQVVQDAWQEFGLPEEIVSDNGRAFTSVYADALTRFGEVLLQKGIQHRLITPYYPEGNGKAEAFVKIVKRECLNRPFATLEALKQALAQFVIYYNHIRLHSSLGYLPPVTRYLGCAAVQRHGLAGIPFLPDELVQAFPPAQPVVVPPVTAATIKQRFALVPVSC
jgi:transposase InsO family protein